MWFGRGEGSSENWLVLLARNFRTIGGLSADCRFHVCDVTDIRGGFRSVRKDAFIHEEIGNGVERESAFLGLIGMIDPAREQAIDAVARAREAGVRTMVITADHPRTPAVLAGEFGIAGDGKVDTGAELEKLSRKELGQTAQDVSVYVLVNPDHRPLLVKALQRGGATVSSLVLWLRAAREVLRRVLRKR